MRGDYKKSQERRLYGVGEGAEMLGISIWTLRQWAYAGRCASVKLGSRLMIPAEELDRLIADGKRARAAETVLA